MQILQNLVEMTGHRDHVRLEVSVLSTMQRLPYVTSVRALELIEQTEGTMVRPRSWQQNGKICSTDAEEEASVISQPLSTYPALEECIQNNRNCAMQTLGPARHAIWLPIWMHNKVRTCIEISQSRPFTTQRLEVLQGIFHVYQNYQSLLDYSERDALTGLLNRKTFDEQISRFASLPSAPSMHPQELPEEDRPDQWIAVIDIDHFKQVNDRFGHLFGDEVLILVANLLRSSFRAQDRIFRFGGEEFVVLLRNVSLRDAKQIFERLRTTVQAHQFPQLGQVTISLGFACTRMRSPVEILGQADQALYYAKQNGRNRVCHYESLLAEGAFGEKVTNHEDMELF